MTGKRIILALSLVGSAAIGAGILVAAALQPPPSAPPVASTLAHQFRQGTLASSHGVRDICADDEMACRTEVLTAASGSPQPLSTDTPVGYGPAELQKAYHLGADQGGGTIAIIDAGPDPNLEADLATYRAQFGLPPCTRESGCLSQLDLQGGHTLAPDPANAAEEETSAAETAVDLEMVSATCPECRLMEIEVPVDDVFTDPADPMGHRAVADFGTAVQTAVRHGADAVSISFLLKSDAINDTGPAARALLHPGVAIVASSGDNGFNGSADGKVPWPQDLPWVTSVGGTSLHAPTASDPDYSETAYHDAGSSCRTDLGPALGQPGPVSAACGGHRAGSDISAVADPATGVAAYDTYAPATGRPHDWIVAGGTSVSAPLIAGMYARAGRNPRVLGPNTLYAKPDTAFNDITTGRNAPGGACRQAGFAQRVCAAGPGWDGPTGLGSPKGLDTFR